MAILSGSRIRKNGVFGTITDNPLTAGAATFNSAALADLPVVTGNHAIITLDPLKQFGNPEIVMVTAHTAAATVATITRGMFGTVARSHPVNTLWVHAATQDDFVEIVTSSTRPSDQYEGQFIFESDTNKLMGFGGVDWAPRDAGGTLGYAQATVSQTGITNLTVDLTGLSVAVTVGTGRRIRISAEVIEWTRTAGTVTFVLLGINEGATVLTLKTIGINNNYNGATASVILTPSAGSHTYKLTGRTDVGGTVTMSATATAPAYILVEDIGAA